MANKKISALTAGTALEVGDLIPYIDVSSADKNKIITRENLALDIDSISPKVTKALYDANTILAADTDDTPAAVTIAEQQVVGRITGGNIKGLSVAELFTLLGIDADLATFSVPASTTISAFIKTLLDDADEATARTTLDVYSKAESSALAVLPLGYLSGLGISHGADTDHDIVIAVGQARDDTDNADMMLASAITKRFDAEWSVGSTNGGFASGEALPASGTIHIWLIKRADTGVVDVFANDHATSGLTPTLPTDYDYKRRIGSYRTDGSNNIINGDWWGNGINRAFMFDTPILDVDTATPGTNAVTAAISTPAGIITRAFMNVQSGGASAIYVSSLANADLPPSNTAAPLSSSGCSGVFRESGGVSAFTNTSSQIRYRSGADEHTYIATLGYEMAL